MAKRTLVINMPELIWAFEDASYEAEHFLDTETGEVITILDESITGEPAPDIDPFDSRYEPIPTFESWQGWQDMSDFAESVEDQTLGNLLMVAIDGKGAFRRFKNVLYDYPKEREQWFAFKEARMHERVLEWLEDLDIVPGE